MKTQLQKNKKAIKLLDKWLQLKPQVKEKRIWARLVRAIESNRLGYRKRFK